MPQTILVVDDNPEVREFIGEYVLRPAGYQVVNARDGREALELVRQQPPDMIVADMQMPRMTGLELMHAVQEGQQHIPFILITAEGSEELAAEAIGAGAAGYIIKPFDPEHLLANVRRSLAWEQIRREQVAALSELKKAHEHLQARVQQLETLQQIGRTVTASLDLDAVLSQVVSAAVALTGAEEGSLLLRDEDTGELIGRAAKYVDDEVAQTLRWRSDDNAARRVLQTGEPCLQGEDQSPISHSGVTNLSSILVPLWLKGRTVGVLSVEIHHKTQRFTRDDLVPLRSLADYAAIAIDNAKLFERTQSERNKLDAILDQGGDAVMVVDDANRLILMNAAACSAFGLNGREVTGSKLTEVVSNSDLHELFARRAADERVRHGEIALADGRTLNAHLTSIEGVGRAVIMQDITHLKELDRIKSEFVSVVAHDIRSPLTVILSYVQLLRRVGPVNERQDEFIRQIEEGVSRITTLITDVLDLGRIEAGFDVRKEDVDLAEIVRQAIELLELRAQYKGHSLDISLPEAVQPIIGHPIRLRQMVTNLIENAIKYTPDGGRIAVALQQTGNQLILIVADNGPGIDPVDQQHIFDKFFRAQNVSQNVSGTGLGLSIVKSIVDNHSGRVWVESQVGEGSVFTVVVPTSAPPPAAPQNDSQHPLPS